MSILYLGVGALVDGRIRIYDQAAMDAELASKRNCEVEFSIDKLYPTRTPPQNSYYWSVVVARVSEKIGQSRRSTHDVLKALFMDPRLVRAGRIRGWISDSGLVLGTTTRDLDRLLYQDFLERICEHAATSAWNCYIPPPDKLWREHALAELQRTFLQTGEIPFDDLE